MDTRLDTNSASSPTTGSSARTGFRTRFCHHLVEARKRRGMSLDQIADVTRIPARSLERLESGEFEKLPADVFVRGFLRSYARCVGLDVDDTIRRYAACGMTPAPVATPMAEELASSMATLDSSPPVTLRRLHADETRPTEATGNATAEQRADGPDPLDESDGVPESIGGDSTDSRSIGSDSSGARATDSGAVSGGVPVTRIDGERSRTGKRKSKRRKKRKPRAARSAPVSAARSAPVSAAPGARTEAEPDVEPGAEARVDSPAENPAPTVGASAPRASAPVPVEPVDREPARSGPVDTPASAGAAPPPAADRSGPEVAATALPPPSLVIDDACPEQAAEMQDARAAEAEEQSDATWRNFLPDALLDSETGSRRGTLTLAVIILVIVATLTMSYLLRRPSPSGDGVTHHIAPASAPVDADARRAADRA